MNIRLVLNTLGKLLLLIAGCMAIPTIMAMYCKTNDLMPFLISMAITICLGLTLRYALPANDSQFSFREAFAISAFAWVFVCFVSCLPTLITDFFQYQIIFDYSKKELTFHSSFINSYFEAMSGYTSTGATVITDIESMPHPLLFWRCFHNGLGGMGILVLFVAILPSLGSAGSKLFRTETALGSGDSSHIYPKIIDLAKSLWVIYIIMTIVLTALLMLAGMSLFDASCHAFSTMGTGGFSTKNTSILFYNSATIEIILIVFMFLSSLNCLVMRLIFKGNIKDLMNNTEFMYYISILLFAIFSVSIVGYIVNETSFLLELRNVSFTLVSLVTTTGFTTVDYDQWHHYGKIIIVLLMIMGGCAGSTSGGIKAIRVAIIAKFIQREFKRLIRPHGVFPITIQDQALEPKAIDALVAYIILFMISLLGFTAFITLLENDVISSFTAVLACLSCVGPGFEAVGPTHNFNDFSDITKVLLTICMALGRLEMMAIFILFSPRVWRK